MGVRNLIGTVCTQIVVTGLLLGVARRVGLVSVHPKVVRGSTARKALDVFVSTSDYVVLQAELLLKSSVKALK